MEALSQSKLMFFTPSCRRKTKKNPIRTAKKLKIPDKNAIFTPGIFLVDTSVVDLDPNPDPHVFGPPGSGTTSQRYGSGTGSCTGSGSFFHRAKIVRKTLIPTI